MRGFTLIELLIAITLSTTTVIMLGQAYRHVLDVKKRYMEKRVVSREALVLLLQKQLYGAEGFIHLDNSLEYKTSMGLSYPYAYVKVDIFSDKVLYREYKSGNLVYQIELKPGFERVEILRKNIIKLRFDEKDYYIILEERQKPVGYFRKF